MEAILIVDDEVEQLRGLRVGLTVSGYKVIDAFGAREALDYLQDKPGAVDLVISDYTMPDMDGLTFLDKMQEMGSRIPLILMTAYGAKEVVIKALRAGCDGYIEKPFTTDELLGEIDRVKELRRLKAGNVVLPLEPEAHRNQGA